MSRDDQFLSWLRDELSMLCADAETQVRSVQQGSSFAARSLHRAAHALQAALGQRGRDTMSLADVRACRRLDVTLKEIRRSEPEASSFWTNDDVRTHPKWAAVRTAASDVLTQVTSAPDAWEATLDTACERLAAAGLSASASGCSDEELELVEQELGVKLPAAYATFLLRFGDSAGGFMHGSDLSRRDLPQINSTARDLVRDAGVTLPESAVVFLMHQGYQFVYFVGGEGDDPHVHLFDEGESVRALGWTFSEWVLRAADDEIAGSRPLEA